MGSIRAVHESLGQPLADGVAADLIKEFDEQFALVERRLASEMEHAARAVPLPGVRRELDLEPYCHRARSKAHIAIDLYVDALKNATTPMTAGGAVAGPTFNIHAPVGAIQTGNHSVTNVHAAFSAADQAIVIAALKQAIDAVISAPCAANTNHLLGVAAEASDIVKATHPDLSRLRQALDVLSSGVQGIASAPQAYQALISAIGMLG